MQKLKLTLVLKDQINISQIQVLFKCLPLTDIHVSQNQLNLKFKCSHLLSIHRLQQIAQKIIQKSDLLATYTFQRELSGQEQFQILQEDKQKLLKNQDNPINTDIIENIISQNSQEYQFLQGFNHQPSENKHTIHHEQYQRLIRAQQNIQLEEIYNKSFNLGQNTINTINTQNEDTNIHSQSIDYSCSQTQLIISSSKQESLLIEKEFASEFFSNLEIATFQKQNFKQDNNQVIAKSDSINQNIVKENIMCDPIQYQKCLTYIAQETTQNQQENRKDIMYNAVCYGSLIMVMALVGQLYTYMSEHRIRLWWI